MREQLFAGSTSVAWCGDRDEEGTGSSAGSLSFVRDRGEGVSLISAQFTLNSRQNKRRRVRGWERDSREGWAGSRPREAFAEERALAAWVADTKAGELEPPGCVRGTLSLPRVPQGGWEMSLET